jgi:LAO/AO transport system kinase
MDEWALNTETVEKAYSGNQQSQASVISHLEHGNDPDIVFGNRYKEIGNSQRIGITGPPGAGKSTIVSGLIGHIRREGHNCAVIACDPSSPYSQGALLGDRTRMSEHFTDPDVFIRSMASRGHMGGLAPTTSIVADFLDLCGYKYIFIETVGVGQTEVDVVLKTDTIVVVLTPESGDSIQMMKAGLLEGADIFCINKFDRSGGDSLISDLEFGLSLSKKDWRPPIVPTIAMRNKGVSELFSHIDEHGTYARANGKHDEKKQERFSSEVDFWLHNRIDNRLWQSDRTGIIQRAMIDGVTPWHLAEQIWSERMEEND